MIDYVVYKSLTNNPISPNATMDLTSVENFINSYKGFPMKTFREFILEAPQVIIDDCIFGREEFERLMGNKKSLGSFRWSGLQDYRAVKNKGDKQAKKFIILTNDKSKYMLGACYDGMFEIFSELNHRVKKTYPNIGEVIEVTTINTHSDQRRNGFSSALYKSVLTDIGNLKIMSDSVQYKGAVSLWKLFINEHKDWKNMIDDKEIKVQLYCMNTKKVVLDDLTGVPDEEIWGGEEMGTYRLIASI